MSGFRILGLFSIIPTAALLTVSFFVLFALRKIETQGLKIFGYVVVALLWLAAILVFSAGVYTVTTGQHPAMCMMQEMMKSKKPGMMKAGRMSSAMRGQKQTMMETQTEMPGMVQSDIDNQQ